MSAIELHFDARDPWIIEQKIFDLLKDFVQPSSTLSPATTVKAIDRLLPPNRRAEDQPEGGEEEDAEGFVEYLWIRFHDVARQIPHDSPAQERLAALVRELQQTTSQTPTIPMGSNETERRIWQDMPSFGWTLWEETDTMGPSSEEGRQPWRNINAYIARLTRDGSVNLIWYGIRALAAALEGQMTRAHEHTSRWEVESDFVPGPELDCYLAVAADWISICGPALFGTNPDISGGEGGPMWEGPPGLSSERWQFWKQRLEELSEQEKVEEQTRQLARDTRQKMTEIEQRAKTDT
ncbi:MAG: hypothetical protein M1823_001112 [Watsoniomyces obsoletus]|nr:MAG: hypothetical protein M1823_001112 [Watsoniomyces obsoletus]